MKIKYLSGPKSGQIEHVQAQVGSVVCGAGLAEEISDGAVTAPNIHSEETYKLPRPGDAHIPEPQWDVVQVAGAHPYVAIQMTIGTSKYLYAGKPEHANARKEWAGGGRFLNPFGREVPQEIVTRYAKACKRNPNLCVENQPTCGALNGAIAGAVAKNRTQSDVQKQLQEAEKLGDVEKLNRPVVLIGGDESEVVWEGSRQ